MPHGEHPVGRVEQVGPVPDRRGRGRLVAGARRVRGGVGQQHGDRAQGAHQSGPPRQPLLLLPQHALGRHGVPAAGQRRGQGDRRPYPVPRVAGQPYGLGEPGESAGRVGGALQGAELDEDGGPPDRLHRFVEGAPQERHGAPLPVGAGLLGRRVQQDVDGPRLGHRGAVQQVPGHHGDRGALPHQLLGGRAVRLPAPPAGPAAEHGVPQQRVGVPVRSARVPPQQAEPGHRGEPAGDPVTMIQATRDHFAKRAPVGPSAVKASRSYTGHGAGLAFDKLNNTWWGPGISQAAEGEWLEVTFDQPTRLLDLVITPGTSTRANELSESALPRRIDAQITRADGEKITRTLTLDQSAGGQRRSFRVGEVTAVRFVLRSAYGAGPEKQVAIAEIEFFGPSNTTS
ncbi:zinc ribbon domain-containing protein [Streptomyces sp. MA15]|uniref:NADase-type glycan-binding domain-containing protein n=1 Tax=Streptomyces sp. MA15 TaxID=3055061 RepID=UPI0025B1A5F0|nr:zinc ribbon domain-containing protein [Streptomyces sp. MA15]MDN3268197.1 zinc ribbon domain-containing protein [Streptomyces sp. MA15]